MVQKTDNGRLHTDIQQHTDVNMTQKHQDERPMITGNNNNF